MNRENTFAVIGSGNGGMALAGKIASKGFKVNIYEGLKPTEAFIKIGNERKIFLEGDERCSGSINSITTDMKKAVEKAEVILIVVPAFAHEPVFKKLIPHIRDGHKIVLIPGNFGTLLLRKMMDEYETSKNLSISELPSLPYACRTIAYNTVHIFKRKKKMKIATWPERKNSEIMEIMNGIFDMFIFGKNVLETSLDNINCVLHPFPVLLNIGGIENKPERYRHYMDGITPLVSENIHKMDCERLLIGKEYSLDLLPVLEQLKMYYGKNESNSVFEYVNSDQSPYKDIYGQSINSRYITEDIPYLVVPSMLLGKAGGIELPVFEICVGMSCILHNTDYVKNGRTLSNLGIEGISREDLYGYVLGRN